ncbi:NUDIX domain-containing protein [Vibrio coralliilyticus]|uniref:NUDIX domain-containing protein n=1 Tax=Vibrio coralliilyticus TaxID=190893 RepID=UPI00148BCD7F|nr:NUDIX domain-containing protein [Vibrio coralliilyticus]NOI29255.1 NUDIX domain-containing protein [Vibrio coralliilyticus]NOI48481.1 NUDIX domain-containing protein [Vibrio coralliilyticus]
MQPFECVSFLLVDNNRILLEKRSIHKASDPGLTCIPGGHIEDGETQPQALCRELKEELDLTANNYHYLCSLYHPTSELQLLHYYVVTEWQGEVKALEAESVSWEKLESDSVSIEADKRAIEEFKRVNHHLC